jgi:hypothetical protein
MAQCSARCPIYHILYARGGGSFGTILHREHTQMISTRHRLKNDGVERQVHENSAPDNIISCGQTYPVTVCVTLDLCHYSRYGSSTMKARLC